MNAIISPVSVYYHILIICAMFFGKRALKLLYHQKLDQNTRSNENFTVSYSLLHTIHFSSIAIYRTIEIQQSRRIGNSISVVFYGIRNTVYVCSFQLERYG